MGRFDYSFELPAPRAVVWQLFVDPERWTQWNTEWTAIRDVRGPFDHPGSGYTQVLRVLGRELEGHWQVQECEPERWRRVAGRLPFGIDFEGVDRFEETTTGTRVSLALEWKTPWGAVGRALEYVLRPLLRRQMFANARQAADLLGSDK